MPYVPEKSAERNASFSHRENLLPVLAVLAGGAILTAVCVLWLDHPLAHAIARMLSPRAMIPAASPAVLESHPATLQIPDLLVPFVAIVAVAALLAWPWAHMHGRSRLARLAPLVAFGEPLALGIKFLSKWVFGRSGVHVFLRTHGYAGFHHWLDGHPPFDSFPSGHMLVITTLFALASAVYPRLRVWYVLALAALGLVLLATSYHFLGDLLAGWLLGQTLAWLILWTDARLRPAAALRTPP